MMNLKRIESKWCALYKYVLYFLRKYFRKFAKTLEEQNLKLAKEQKDNNDLFNRYGLTNVPNELYFNQFNQSTR